MLDAAAELFLAQGYGRTTLDQVSERARTGKSSLYGRYGSKEKLFAAVVTRSINDMFADLVAVPSERDRKDRLRHLGLDLVRVLLTNRCVSLMRIVAAEAATFPELATLGYRMSFEGSARVVARTLADGDDEAKVERMLPVACRFVELALQPIAFQATFGRPMDELLAKAPRDVEDAITLLIATGRLSDA
ncbi:TetR/AcrR family transcriptional regulator [Sphingomonas sp. CLY1604]|uniref:TetR/AcrR family transcriptional regulator n=1 Tax=Sphingomonas sp. CLY1604 TaxID=3457786 RepID=UPI003FD6E3B7